MGRLDGKVAVITGAARGQGRSHAVRLAQEGADVIALDIASQIGSVPYAMATADDLAQTVREIEGHSGRAIAFTADVRDYDALKAAIDNGVESFGRLDIVVANGGIASFGKIDELSEQTWKDMIDVNLTGVWHTSKAAIPHLRSSGGGSIIITSSAAGHMPSPGLGHYSAAKHGLVGLMRAMAGELGPDRIRVNSIHPGHVDTPMIQNQAVYHVFYPEHDDSDIQRDEIAPRFEATNALPIPWMEPGDVSNLVVFLASHESRYMTGAVIPLDSGFSVK